MKFLIETDIIKHSDQKYTSARTSINSSKLPAIFNLINLGKDTINLDYGGGKFDNATGRLKTQGVTNLIYDPYNRSSEWNDDVLFKIKQSGGADTATLSNVLNVIAEESVRIEVLRNIKQLLKPNGTLFITVYEGSGRSGGAETKAGYQMNRKTKEYLDEIKSVFNNVSIKGRLIIAK